MPEGGLPGLHRTLRESEHEHGTQVTTQVESKVQKTRTIIELLFTADITQLDLT